MVMTCSSAHQSSNSTILMNSRTHSFALAGIPLDHGLSQQKGRHLSQSVPTVLCRHSQLSRPSRVDTLQRAAWPLHLQRPPTARSDSAQNRVSSLQLKTHRNTKCSSVNYSRSQDKNKKVSYRQQIARQTPTQSNNGTVMTLKSHSRTRKWYRSINRINQTLLSADSL